MSISISAGNFLFASSGFARSAQRLGFYFAAVTAVTVLVVVMPRLRCYDFLLPYVLA